MSRTTEQYPCILGDDLCEEETCRYWISWMETGNCACRVNREHTLQEIGDAMGITRERVRQLEERLLPKMAKIIREEMRRSRE